MIATLLAAEEADINVGSMVIAASYDEGVNSVGYPVLNDELSLLMRCSALYG